MGFDIVDGIAVDGIILINTLHQLHLRRTTRRCDAVAPAIVVDARSENHRMYPVLIGPCLFERLQDQHAHSLRWHKSICLLVKSVTTPKR
ncbi:hypothetical protein N9118_00555 [Akkermansiaceae bacterium]|nr:hypothetical protein [Akkermansiaceae bacterium]